MNVMVLAVALAATALPPHPWAKFKPGAWVTFMAGVDEFHDGTITLKSVKGQKVELVGSGMLEAENSVNDLGWLRPSASATGKKVATEKVTVLGKTLEADVWEYKDAVETVREWVAAGIPHPLKREASFTVNGKVNGSSLVLVGIDEALYVGPKRLLTAHYQGKRTSGETVDQWLSHEVPGGTVLRVFTGADGKATESRMAVGFGEGGKPLSSLKGLWWHAWASHPVGAWERHHQFMQEKGESAPKAVPSELSMLKKNEGYVFFGKRGEKLDPKKPGVPIGSTAAAADPTGKLQSSAYVKVEGVEIPCLLYCWEGRDENGEAVTRSDCVSSISRVPIYSTESAAFAGVRYRDSWVAQTREQSVKVGARTVRAVTFEVTQKLSNGGGSKRKTVMSAEVPGGEVSSETDLGLGKGFEKTFELLEFGER